MAQETVVGYCGVVFAEARFWQGYFITEETLELGRQGVPHLRQVIEQFKNPGTTYRATETAAPEDQVLLGSICASVVNRALLSDYERIQPLLGAIAVLTGERFFMIKASRPDGQGTNTVFQPFGASSREEIMNYMNSLPEVIAAKKSHLRDVEKRAMEGKLDAKDS